MVKPEDIAEWIRAGLDGADVAVEGDGHHFEAVITYAGFEGCSRIERHKQVYAALGDRMKADIHALSMKTLTPDEAAS